MEKRTGEGMRRCRKATRTAAIRKSSQGITLIETMVVVALVAILGGIAVGPFKGMLDRNRIAGEITGFVGDLQYARSEAITRGVPVSVCPSSDGVSCASSNVWHGGWAVFVDADGSGVIVSAADVLRGRKAWNAGDTFVATPGVTRITYGRDGFSLSLPATVTFQAHASPVDDHSTRCVAVNRIGRQSVVAAGEEGCA